MERIPLEWLREYVDYENLSPAKLAEILTSSCIEVEQVVEAGTDDKIVVAEITEIRPHPNADRLQLATVTVGSKKLEVVCGAPNIAVGQKVPLALVGAVIQGQTLEAATIRGVQSEGMLCSGAELGFSDDHSGIMILDSGLKTGQSLDAALHLSGAVIEASIPSNRPDLFGIIGVARDLASTLQARGHSAKFSQPKLNLKEGKTPVAGHLSVKVESKKDCLVYLARVIEFDPKAETPGWMARRLEEAGVRTVSLPVDVTNYVMLESAQPLHAFDADRVSGGVIEVRRAKEGESIRTLDGVERKLSADQLVIADSEGSIAIAGVMGGASTEVSETTRRVILEAALFDGVVVRQGATALGMRTDASTRFEKGLPVSGVKFALDRAAELISENGNGEIWQGTAGSINEVPKAPVIELGDEVASFGGVSISRDKIKKILEGSDCKVTGDKIFKVEPPAWRRDLKMPGDLVEEVLVRIGYDEIPSELSGQVIGRFDRVTPIRRRIQSVLVGTGAYEVTTYSFISEDMARTLGIPLEKLPRLKNPRTPEQALLRSELISRHLEVASQNARRGYREQTIFEISHVFEQAKKDEVIETTQLGVMAWGENSFLSLKGTLETLAKALGLEMWWRPVKNLPSFWHPGRSAELYLGGKLVGTFGEIHPEVVSSFKLGGRASVAVIDYETLLGLAEKARVVFKPIKRFQVKRDISFDVAINKEWQEIWKAVLGDPVNQVDMQSFDSAPGLKEGHKNILLTLTIEADRTLTGEEIEAVEERVRTVLKKEFQAKIR